MTSKQRHGESGNVPRLIYNGRNQDRDDCVDRTRGGEVEVVDERLSLASCQTESGAAYVTGCVKGLKRAFGCFEWYRCIEENEGYSWTKFRGGCDKNEVVVVDARVGCVRHKCHVEKNWW